MKALNSSHRRHPRWLRRLARSAPCIRSPRRDCLVAGTHVCSSSTWWSVWSPPSAMVGIRCVDSRTQRFAGGGAAARTKPYRRNPLILIRWQVSYSANPNIEPCQMPLSDCTLGACREQQRRTGLQTTQAARASSTPGKPRPPAMCGVIT